MTHGHSLPPPAIPMIDQVLDWLDQHSASDVDVPEAAAMGVGAAALCLHWSTYLAVLLDEDKPADPRCRDGDWSMVSDSKNGLIVQRVWRCAARL